MKTSLSLSEMAVQMENLLHTLIPFKRKEIEKWKEIKERELKNLSQWYDTHISSLGEEIEILCEHAAALGMPNLDPDAVRSLGANLEGDSKRTATELHLGIQRESDSAIAAQKEGLK